MSKQEKKGGDREERNDDGTTTKKSEMAKRERWNFVLIGVHILNLHGVVGIANEKNEIIYSDLQDRKR